jgi:hypothetical protein
MCHMPIIIQLRIFSRLSFSLKTNIKTTQKYNITWGARGSVVKALCYKLEGRGFETR